MNRLLTNLKTALAVVKGRATIIELKNNEVIVVPHTINRAKLQQVATCFFREAYNLQ